MKYIIVKIDDKIQVQSFIYPSIELSSEEYNQLIFATGEETNNIAIDLYKKLMEL